MIKMFGLARAVGNDVHPLMAKWTGIPDCALSSAEQELFDDIPMYREWNRFSESWKFGDGVTPLVKIDPNWPDLDRSISEANDKMRAMQSHHAAAQLEHGVPVTAERNWIVVTPDEIA